MIAAYTALHYGSPYLGYAIRSVIGAVDRYIVLYAPHGSHGTRESFALPPTEHASMLYDIAERAANGKLEWVQGNWQHEGQHRDSILTHASNADAILVLDYDEIWPEGAAEEAIDQALQGQARKWRSPMVHFWRSFYRCVLHDPAYPIRVIVPDRNGDTEATLNIPPIAHMGYAIPTWLVRYKMHIHGHRAELREGWLADRWLPNAQEDCHPVGSEFWNPETVFPVDYLNPVMWNHPYWNKEVIE